jgi:hypothetical protein
MKYLQKYVNQYENLFDAVVDFINPDANGFMKVNYDELSKISPSDYGRTSLECWTESKCLFIMFLHMKS